MSKASGVALHLGTVAICGWLLGYLVGSAHAPILEAPDIDGARLQALEGRVALLHKLAGIQVLISREQQHLIELLQAEVKR